MPSRIVPARLTPGGHVRVIAPARSLAIVPPEVRQIADQRIADLGLTLSFGRHVEECDRFLSSSVDSRVADLHEAFSDPGVDAILTVLGGYNSNQLLPHLDWNLIGGNPKILCGYSDVTALACAVTAVTGLVTYCGPHYSSFGMRDHLDQTLSWFEHTMFSDQPLVVQPSSSWTDDPWYRDQAARSVRPAEGPWVINPGHADGRLTGGNLCTLTLLQGTPWMPVLAGSVLFVEDDEESSAVTFDRDLTSLTQQPGFDDVQALLIGRFQAASGVDRETITAIVGANPTLDRLPVVANLDFGHTNPMLTLPVGGRATVAAHRTEDLSPSGATTEITLRS